MTAKAGRALKVLLLTPPDTEAALVAGVQEKSLSFSSEGIDITNDDDNGVRALLPDTASVKTLDVSIKGVTKDTVLEAWHVAGDHRQVTLEYPLQNAQTNPRTVSGTFRCTSYESKGSTDGAIEFTASLQSSGVFTVTAGS